MKKGDIIVLQTRGGNGAGNPPQTLTFGVIQDDNLILMYKDDAIKNHGFPWDFCNPTQTTTSRIGIMVRNVKWYRQGELRAVRGPNQAPWLAECSPLWLGKVGVKTRKVLTMAIKKMSYRKFLLNTKAIENEWSMS